MNMPKGIPNRKQEPLPPGLNADGSRDASMDDVSFDDGPVPVATDNPYASLAAARNGDTGGKKDMQRIKEVFFDHYPSFRPSYADVQVCMASLYSISVRGVLSSGQHKCLDAIERRCKQRGTW